MAFQCPVDIRQALEVEAAKLDRSLSWVIVNRLKQSLETDGLLPKTETKKA
jgi:hypothetical protein